MRRLPLALGLLLVVTLVPTGAYAGAHRTTVEDAVAGCSIPFALRIAADDPIAPCQGVRPGGALIVRSGDIDIVYCTMSFLITDGIDVYLSTAGHCTLEELGAPSLGEDVYAHGVKDAIGKVAYTWCEGRAANGGCGGGADFGLIRLNARGVKNASPVMCSWTAPSGIFGEHDALMRETRHFGWGSGIGAVGAGTTLNGRLIQPANPLTQSRHSLGIDFTDETIVLGWGAAIPGDSGSGILVTELPNPPSLVQPRARALGTLTHISAGGLMIIQRLDASLAKAGTDMRRKFKLWDGKG